MARARTRRCVFDTTATETAPGSNAWRWKTQGFEWELDLGTRGVNFSLVTGDARRPVAFFEKLDPAVAYAWGFTHGFNEHGRTAGT